MARLSSNARGRLSPLAANLVAGPRTLTRSHPTDDRQLDDKDHERRPEHRADGRWDDFWLDVDRFPDRETSPAATLAGGTVPDREGYRHELSGRERGARGWSKRPLE